MKAVTIVTGILTAILGFAAMFMPVRMFLALGWLIGIVLMINGVEISVNGFSGKKNIWQGILGIVVAIGGLILLCDLGARVLTDVMIAAFVGAAIILSGICLIVNAVKNFKNSKGMAVAYIILAILEILAGGFAMMHPLLTMLSVGIIIAVNLLVQGISLTVMGFSMEK